MAQLQQLEQALNQLQALVQQQGATIQAQNHTIQQLQLPGQPPPPAAPAAVVPIPKVAKPEDFDGRSEHLENFIHQCSLFLSLNNYTDQSKITLTLSYMKKGSALAWAEQKLAEYSTGQPNANPVVPPWAITWPNFLTELRASFGDVSREQTARLHLPNLQQTHSVDEYNVDFMGLYPLTGFNESAGIEIYKKGLKNHILRRIMNEATPPTNFAGWRTRASHYDRVDKEIRETERHSSTPSKSHKHGRTIPTTTSHSADRQRTLTASSSSASRTAPASSSSTLSSSQRTTAAPAKVKQERIDPVLAAQRKEARLCILCGKVGHFANKCTNPINPGPILLPATERRGLPSGRGAHAHHQKKRRVNNIEVGESVESSGSK